MLQILKVEENQAPGRKWIGIKFSREKRKRKIFLTGAYSVVSDSL